MYENENYRIEVRDDKYRVINKVTGVTEYETEVLPEALAITYKFHRMLDTFEEEVGKDQPEIDMSISLDNTTIN